MDDEKPKRRLDWRDLMGLLGVCLISYGAWLIYQPAAFIVSGATLIALAVVAARR